jgi:nicotinamidase-related amidase
MPHPTAHLLVDMVNPMDFPGAEKLLPQARVAAERIAHLKKSLRGADIPTVYVNDNFGRWDLGFRELVEFYRSAAPPGASLLDYIAPEPDDHFILKPKHSGFYATSLEVLLGLWHTRRLILTGVAGNICVMYTAIDAHMRDFELVVPSDCTASEDDASNAWALEQMRRVMDADVRSSDSLDLSVGRPAPQRRAS